MKTTLHVRAKHIRRGKRHSELECPCSLALQEAVGGQQCWTGYRCIGIVAFIMNVPYSMQSAEMPATMIQWVNDFDAGKPVKPASFELDFRRGIVDG